MTGGRPLRESTYRRDFKWHCPVKQTTSAPNGRSCPGGPQAHVGPSPTNADFCVCNQPATYLRKDTMTTTYQLNCKLATANPLYDVIPPPTRRGRARRKRPAGPVRVGRRCWGVRPATEAEVSALAELLNTAYSTMQPCVNSRAEIPPTPPPPTICYQPQIDPCSLADMYTCSGSPNEPPPRVYRQLPIPPCRQHLPVGPPYAGPPNPCVVPQHLNRSPRSAQPCSFRVVLGADGSCPEPPPPVYFGPPPCQGWW